MVTKKLFDKAKSQLDYSTVAQLTETASRVGRGYLEGKLIELSNIDGSSSKFMRIAQVALAAYLVELWLDHAETAEEILA